MAKSIPCWWIRPAKLLGYVGVVLSREALSIRQRQRELRIIDSSDDKETNRILFCDAEKHVSREDRPHAFALASVSHGLKARCSSLYIRACGTRELCCSLYLEANPPLFS